MIGGELIVNPTLAQKDISDLQLTVASTREKVIMIEAGANEIPEDKMIEAIFLAHEVNHEIIAFIDKIVAECGKEKHTYESCAVPEELFAAIKEVVTPEAMEEAVFTDDKQTREGNIRAITEKLEEAFAENEEWLALIPDAVYQYQKKTVRKMILRDHKRPDGREITPDSSSGSRDRPDSARSRFRYVHPRTDADLYHHHSGSSFRGTETGRTG